MTPSKKLKQLHRKSNFGQSLKEFVRELQSKGDTLGAEWFRNKGPSQKNRDKARRLEKHGARIAAEKQATRAAKQKRSSAAAAKQKR